MIRHLPLAQIDVRQVLQIFWLRAHEKQRIRLGHGDLVVRCGLSHNNGWAAS